MRSDPQVPLPLINHVSRIIFGNVEENDKGFKGFDRLRTDALKQAADLAKELHCPKCGSEIEVDAEDHYLAYLREEKSAYLYQASVFDKEIRVRERLIDPELMNEAFQLLSDESDDDRSWPIFAEAAIQAFMNFKEYRRLERKAKQLGKSISATAAKLARLVRELQETGVGLPAELMPVNNHNTISGPSAEARHLQLLQLIRLLETNLSAKSEASVPNLDLRSYLWQVSKVANELQPDLVSPAIRFAISTRQDSKKTSYIRAFAALLRQGKIDITPLVKRAMAITGNVIFDDCNMNITEDDVRKALAVSERTHGRQVRAASSGKVRRS